MEKYIQEGKYLLLHHEWAGGTIPKEKALKSRAKALTKGEAYIVKPEDFFEKNDRKIVRKGFNHAK